MPVSIITKDYGMTAVEFNRLLHHMGIQCRLGGAWLLYQRYANKGYTKSRTYCTPDGKLISSYECASRTADAEFALSKRQYVQLTGRSQGGSDIIAYHTRQAFLSGEVTPEEANRIGRELAMAFTKGKHAFVACTHIDREHVHNHIIFNSTALDCKRKFRNFIGSAFALRRFSDRIK